MWRASTGSNESKRTNADAQPAVVELQLAHIGIASNKGCTSFTIKTMRSRFRAYQTRNWCPQARKETKLTDHGEYVACDSPEGIRRLRKAAENGNIQAANKLIELALAA
jgi:hypothetical protein